MAAAHLVVWRELVVGQTAGLRVRAAVAVREVYSVEPVVAMAMPKVAGMLSGAVLVALLEMMMPPELAAWAGLHSTAVPVAEEGAGVVPVLELMEERVVPGGRSLRAAVELAERQEPVAPGRR